MGGGGGGGYLDARGPKAEKTEKNTSRPVCLTRQRRRQDSTHRKEVMTALLQLSPRGVHRKVLLLVVGLAQGRSGRKQEEEEEEKETSGHCLHLFTESRETSLLGDSSLLTGRMEAESSPPSLDLYWRENCQQPKKKDYSC